MNVDIIIIINDKFEANEIEYIWIWKNYYLNKIKDIFQMKNYDENKIMMIYYNWYFIKDMRNLIIIEKKCNMIRKNRLIYSQFYMMNKLQFDVIKHFSWNDNNDIMIIIIIDLIYQKIL